MTKLFVFNRHKKENVVIRCFVWRWRSAHQHFLFFFSLFLFIYILFLLLALEQVMQYNQTRFYLKHQCKWNHIISTGNLKNDDREIFCTNSEKYEMNDKIHITQNKNKKKKKQKAKKKKKQQQPKKWWKTEKYFFELCFHYCNHLFILYARSAQIVSSFVFQLKVNDIYSAVLNRRGYKGRQSSLDFAKGNNHTHIYFLCCAVSPYHRITVSPW